VAVISGGNIIEGSASPTFIRSLGSPALGAVDAVLAAVTDTGDVVTITTGLTNPDVPRNVTATAGGTAGDIAAVHVIVKGTNAEGVEISETLPAFTENSTGTVVGAKAFATVTAVTIPAHDDVGAETSIGVGAKLGIGDRLAHGDTIASGFLDGVREATRPTAVTSPTAIESNTVTLSSALNGTDVQVEYTR